MLGLIHHLDGAALDAPAAAAEACPVLVTRPIADAIGLTPGDSLSINVRPPGVASALPAVDCRVFGIADFAFATNDELAAVTTIGGPPGGVSAAPSAVCAATRAAILRATAPICRSRLRTPASRVYSLMIRRIAVSS